MLMRTGVGLPAASTGSAEAPAASNSAARRTRGVCVFIPRFSAPRGAQRIVDFHMRLPVDADIELEAAVHADAVRSRLHRVPVAAGGGCVPRPPGSGGPGREERGCDRARAPATIARALV